MNCQYCFHSVDDHLDQNCEICAMSNSSCSHGQQARRNPKETLKVGDIYEAEECDEDQTPFFVITNVSEEQAVVRPVRQVASGWEYSGETAGVKLDRYGRLKGFKRGLFDQWAQTHKRKNPYSRADFWASGEAKDTCQICKKRKVGDLGSPYCEPCFHQLTGQSSLDQDEGDLSTDDFSWGSDRALGNSRFARNPDPPLTHEQHLLDGDIRRATGRIYRIDVSKLDPESVREMRRLLRDLQYEITNAKKRNRWPPV